MINLVFGFERVTIVVTQPDENGCSSLAVVDEKGSQVMHLGNDARAALVEVLTNTPTKRLEGSQDASEIEAARRIYAAALGSPEEDAARRNLVAVIERVRGVRLAS